MTDTLPPTDEPIEIDMTGPDADTDETDAPEAKPDVPETVPRTELEKAVARRDKATERARALQAELDEIKKKDTPEATAEERAHAKLRGSAARATLAGMGVTEKTDQTAVLKHIDLSGIPVDDDGDVDEDALEEIFSVFAKAFKGKGSAARSGGTSARAKPVTAAPAKTHDQQRWEKIFKR